MSGDLDLPARPFSKEAQLARGARRYRRTVAGPKRRAAIMDAKAGPCRVCVWIGANPKRARELDLRECGQATTFHHVVPKGSPYHGADTEANWVPLGGSGTTGHHGAVESERHPGACRALVESLDDAEYAYAVEHGGENFFERRYGLRYDRA